MKHTEHKKHGDKPDFPIKDVYKIVPKVSYDSIRDTLLIVSSLAEPTDRLYKFNEYYKTLNKTEKTLVILKACHISITTIVKLSNKNYNQLKYCYTLIGNNYKKFLLTKYNIQLNSLEEYIKNTKTKNNLIEFNKSTQSDSYNPRLFRYEFDDTFDNCMSRQRIVSGRISKSLRRTTKYNKSYFEEETFKRN